MFRTLMIGIRNLKYYFNTIWRDRDWDYYFLLELMKVKIDKMITFYKKDSIIIEEDRDKIVNQLIFVSKELQIALDQSYCDKEYQELLSDDTLYNLEEDFSDATKEKFLAVFDLESRRMKANLKNIFNTIRDNILTWWD